MVCVTRDEHFPRRNWTWTLFFLIYRLCFVTFPTEDAAMEGFMKGKDLKINGTSVEVLFSRERKTPQQIAEEIQAKKVARVSFLRSCW